MEAPLGFSFVRNFESVNVNIFITGLKGGVATPQLPPTPVTVLNTHTLTCRAYERAWIAISVVPFGIKLRTEVTKNCTKCSSSGCYVRTSPESNITKDLTFIFIIVSCHTNINFCSSQTLIHVILKVWYTTQLSLKGAKNVPALLGLEVDHLDNTWRYENTSSHLN